MSRNWKIGAQMQAPELPSKIELLKVTHDPEHTTVVGRIEWSEDPTIQSQLVDIRVGFDGRPAGRCTSAH